MVEKSHLYRRLLCQHLLHNTDVMLLQNAPQAYFNLGLIPSAASARCELASTHSHYQSPLHYGLYTPYTSSQIVVELSYKIWVG